MEQEVQRTQKTDLGFKKEDTGGVENLGEISGDMESVRDAGLSTMDLVTLLCARIQNLDHTEIPTLSAGSNEPKPTCVTSPTPKLSSELSSS